MDSVMVQGNSFGTMGIALLGTFSTGIVTVMELFSLAMVRRLSTCIANHDRRNLLERGDSIFYFFL
jgi:hypothetical protein